MNSILAKVVVAIAYLGSVFGIPSDRGRTLRDWEHKSVVYAEVLEVANAGLKGHMVTLRILATLTGPLDPAESPEVTAQGYFQGDVSAMDKLPVVKSHVIVVLKKTGLKDPEYMIPSELLKFMPQDCALVEVSGFNDSKTDTIRASLIQLRKVHSNARAEAAKEATRPKAKP